MQSPRSAIGRIAEFTVLAAVALSVLTAVPADAAAAGGGASTALVARGSVEQAYVTGVQPGAQMILLNRSGRQVQSRHADALGGVVFRAVAPGRGYRVRAARAGGAESAR